MAVIYGITNCDTVKKARKWLQAQGIDARFHDFRKDGLEPAQLQQWVDELGWETLLNKRGTTFRQLPDEAKTNLDAQRAMALMLEQPAMIKRPVLDTGKQRVVGFSEANYAQLLS